MAFILDLAFGTIKALVIGGIVTGGAILYANCPTREEMDKEINSIKTCADSSRSIGEFAGKMLNGMVAIDPHSHLNLLVCRIAYRDRSNEIDGLLCVGIMGRFFRLDSNKLKINSGLNISFS